VAFNQQSGVSVIFEDVHFADLSAVVDAYVSQFKAAGSTDAAISGATTTKVDGVAVVDFRFTFTPTGKRIKPIWFVRAAQTARGLVILQTFDYATASASALAQVRSQQLRLAGSLHL
jgi:hypothetical protein